MSEPRVLTPQERYLRDPQFAHMVNTFLQAIEELKYTPTEIREAAMLAAVMYSQRHPAPIFTEVSE
jgi:hypothetical protein